MFNIGKVGQMYGVVDVKDFAAFHKDMVDNARISGNDVHIVFTAQTLLNDFHMQQSEKTAAEPEAQSRRSFRLVEKCRVIELEFRH